MLFSSCSLHNVVYLAAWLEYKRMVQNEKGVSGFVG